MLLHQSGRSGCHLKLLNKIDELVDGRGSSRDGQRVKWRTMRDAANDLEGFPPARRLFGPVVQTEVRQRLSGVAAEKF